jgi:hypothetical protein
MAADEAPDRPDRDGGALSKVAAAEVGAMVAEQVRQAIESAERSAEELRQQALDRASADRESVHRMADQVIDRIDDVEARIGELLQSLRDEVVRTAQWVDRAEVGIEAEHKPETEHGWRAAPEAPASPPVRATLRDARAAPEVPTSPPVALNSPEAPAPVAASASAPVPAQRARRRRFGRHVLPECAVCGRAPSTDEALEAWQRTGKLSLCPECRHDGWQLPAGARVPSRPARRVGS